MKWIANHGWLPSTSNELCNCGLPSDLFHWFYTPIFHSSSGHQDSVTHVTFSPDGYYLATGDMAGGVRVWLRPSNATNQWLMVMSETVGDLLWLRWWQPFPASQAGSEKSVTHPRMVVLAAGDEDGLVAAWSVTARNSSNSKSAPVNAKYFPGKLLSWSFDYNSPKNAAIFFAFVSLAWPHSLWFVIILLR